MKRFLPILLSALLLAGCGASHTAVSPKEDEAAGISAPSGESTLSEEAFFASLPREFAFASGAGGWSTELSLSSDGTFTGHFHDSDMGDADEAYPYGTLYFCDFSGRFGEVSQIDEYTYSMRLLELTVEAEPEQEKIEDGVRYITSTPYGLDHADEIMVYLPGAPSDGLPQDFIDWVSMPLALYGDFPAELPCYGLYNVEGRQGWFSGFPAPEG